MALTKAQAQRIDDLIARASSALDASEWMGAESASAEALREAQQHSDYERMIAALKSLHAARDSRVGAALSTKTMHRLSSYAHLEPLLSGEVTIQSACYLIEPVLVAADGRELRERALELGVPIYVMVREPKTQLGLWPVVMVGPETVRTKLDPPKRLGVAWFKAASEALASEAISRINPEADASVRVDQLVAMLETVVDSALLHEALLEALDEASRAVTAGAGGGQS